MQQYLSFVRDWGVKSCFIMLLKLRWVNPSPLRLQLTFLALFSTYNLLLLLSHSYFFLVFPYSPIRWWVFLWKSSAECLFYFQITMLVLQYNLTIKTRCSVINRIFKVKALLFFFVSLFKLGIKFSKKTTLL